MLDLNPPDTDRPALLEPLPPALAEAVRRRWVDQPNHDDTDGAATSRFANYT